MFDDILKTPSMRVFCEEVEKSLAEIFECQRATVVLVDRFKKDIYRYIYDQKTHEEKI